MTYDERMSAILIADHERHQARLEAEAKLTPAERTQVVDPYHRDREITGEPSDKNRTHRASDDCWKRGLRTRTVGIAPGTEHTSDGTATVAVIVNGTTTIRSAHSFTKAHIATKQRQHVESKRKASELERLQNIVGHIGNVE